MATIRCLFGLVAVSGKDIWIAVSGCWVFFSGLKVLQLCPFIL